MAVIAALIAAITFQSVAAFLAFRLVHITGRRTAWNLIAAALLLMAVRRIIPLFRLLAGDQAFLPDPLNEYVGLVLSMLMMIGIWRIGPLFIERQKLDEANAFLASYNRSLIEASLDPLVTIGPDGKITDLNTATEAVTGLSRRELEGTDFSNYFTDPAKAKEGYLKVLAEGKTKDYPLTIRHTSGRTTDVLYNAAVYRNEAGKIQGVFAAARDISDMKRMEEATAQLAAIVESSFDAIIGKNLRGEIVSWNRGAETIYGYTAEEVIGKPISILATEEYHHEVYDILGKAIAGETVEHLETLRVRKDGRIIHVSLTVSPIRDPSGSIVGASTIARDITERKRMEREMQENAAYVRGLIETSLDPLVTIGPDGKITDANTATETITGFSRGELIGADFANYFTEPEKARQGYKQVFREGFVRDYPLDIRHRDGHITAVLYNASVYKDRAGNVVGVFAAARDITDRKLAEEAQQRLNRELRAISNCNQTLMRAEDEQTLLNEVCRIVCEEAGYLMAWVGYAEHDDARTIRPVAWAGTEEGYLEQARLTWADVERGHGPSGTAIRSGESSCIQDFIIDANATPWRENALQRGYRSCISLPLKDEDAKTFGILTIYSAKPNAFTPDEIRLLEELAGDLAFGIMVLHARIERARAVEILRESEARLQEAQRIAHMGHWTLDLRKDTLYWSDEVYRMFGLEPQEFDATYEAFLARVHPDDRDIVNRAYTESVKDRKGYDIEHRIVLKDGEIRHVNERCATEYDNNGSPLRSLGTVLDITRRKQTEEELNRLNEELEQRVKDRTSELEQKNRELDRMNKLFIGRELKMIELKERIRELEGAATRG